MKGNLTRILIGLLAVLIISQMGGLFYPSFETSSDTTSSDIDWHHAQVIVIGFVSLFVATSVGGFIARARFVVPAMAYATSEFAYGVYRGIQVNPILSQIGEPDFSYLLGLSFTLVVTLVIAAAGSVAGIKFFAMVNSRRVENR